MASKDKGGESAWLSGYALSYRNNPPKVKEIKEIRAIRLIKGSGDWRAGSRRGR